MNKKKKSIMSYISRKKRVNLLILIFIVIVVLIFTGSADTYGQKKKIPYIWLLKNCNQEVFTKTFEYPFLAILEDHLKDRYKNYKSLEERKSFIDYYWREKDPNPLLPENEYLKDFIQRCQHVQEKFSLSDPPYFDERGKYYLKYGEPSIRYTQESQTKIVDFFQENMMNPESNGVEHIKIKKFLAAMVGSGTDQYLPITYTIQANETWVYKFRQGDKETELVLHFIKEGDYCREVQSLEDVIIHPRLMKIRYFYWADLLKERATALQSHSVFRVYEDILEFEEEIRSAGDKGDYYPLYASSHDIMNPGKKFSQFNNDLEITHTTLKHDAPGTVFTSEKAVQTLYFHYDVVQFRGSGHETDMVINYFSFLNNFNDDTQVSVADSVTLHYSTLFEDQMLEKVIERKSEHSYDIRRISELNLPYLIGGMNISLPPRPGRISLQVKDEGTQRIGFIKSNIHLRDFSTRELCISDIQFCQMIEDSLYRECAPVRTIEGISVIPYPYENINRSDHLFCYFEIYNIKTSGLTSLYSISLDVTTAKEQKSFMAKTTEVFHKTLENSISMDHTRSVEQDDSQELIGIDFSNLKKGNYILTIRVSDLEDSGIRAETKRNLHIRH